MTAQATTTGSVIGTGPIRNNGAISVATSRELSDRPHQREMPRQQEAQAPASSEGAPLASAISTSAAASTTNRKPGQRRLPAAFAHQHDVPPQRTESARSSEAATAAAKGARRRGDPSCPLPVHPSPCGPQARRGAEHDEGRSEEHVRPRVSS